MFIPKRFSPAKIYFDYTCLTTILISSISIIYVQGVFRRYQDGSNIIPQKAVPYYFILFAGLALFAIAFYKVISLLHSLFTNRRLFNLILFSPIILSFSLFLINNYFNSIKGPHFSEISQKKANNYNIIIFLSDALRADYMSVYDYPVETTPFIKKQYEDNKAFIFKQVTSLGYGTGFSVPAMLSSINTISIKDNSSSSDIEYLPEILKSIGYRTFAISSNPGINRIMLGHGFEWFLEDEIDPVFNSSLIYILGKVLPNLGFPSLKGFYQREIKSMAQKTFKWIKRHQKENFFVYFHAMETHTPYLPPPAYMSQLGFSYLKGYKSVVKITNDLYNKKHPGKEALENYINRYCASIRYTDYIAKLFFEKLKELGLLHKTIFIFTADHGDAFLEKGISDRARYLTHTYNNPYQELFHIPLIFWVPDEYKFQKGFDSNLVTTLDIAPTVLELLNIPIPHIMEGKSLLEEPSKFSNRQVVIDNGTPWRIGRFGLKKLILFKQPISNGFWILNSDKTDLQAPFFNKSKFTSLLKSEEMKIYKNLIQKLRKLFISNKLLKEKMFWKNHEIEYIFFKSNELAPELKENFPNGLILFDFSQIKDSGRSYEVTRPPLLLRIHRNFESPENLISETLSNWPKQLINKLALKVPIIPGYYELYDLENDPKENQDLLIINEDRVFFEMVNKMVEKMDTEYESLKDKSKYFRKGKKKVYSKEEIKRLKALGYLK